MPQCSPSIISFFPCHFLSLSNSLPGSWLFIEGGSVCMCGGGGGVAGQGWNVGGFFFFFSRTDVLGSICKRWITRRRESIIQSGEKKNGNSGPMLGLRAPFSIWRHDFWKGGKRGVYVLYKGNGSTRKRRRWREGWRLERGRDGSQILSLAHFVSFLFLSFFFFSKKI